MLVGIDIGTQSLKAVVTDHDLVMRGEASGAYQPSFPRPGWAEQDTASWENAIGPTIARALAAAAARPEDVRGLGVCGQLDGCIAVDAAGRALTQCLIWMDRRAAAETADIPAALVRRRTGVVLDAGHMAAKIRWLRRHQPDCRAARFHQPVSYLLERLTGGFTIDHALASTTMVYALERRGYDAELLDRFEIDAASLPAIADAASCGGRLHADGAALTGLRPGIPVAVGTGDDFSTPLGAGLIAPGRVAVVLGTGEVVGAIHPQPIIDDDDLVETHAYPGGAYFIENPGWLSGGAIAWLQSLLGIARPGDLDALAAEIPPGADDLIFLPALSGAMAPRWSPSARGCFYGLTPAHHRGHLARAVLEGCAFAMRDVVDRLADMQVATDSILLLGGGARSDLWAQLRADVSGRPVIVPRRIDTSPMGAAMLAGVATGIIRSLAEAAGMVIAEGVEVMPDPAKKDAYDASHAAYRRLFDSLEPNFERRLLMPSSRGAQDHA